MDKWQKGQNQMEIGIFLNLNASHAEWAPQMKSETEREQSFHFKSNIHLTI